MTDPSKLLAALEVFAGPRATSRTGDGETPEQDTMTIEVTAGDWIRACVLTGRMDVEYLRTLPEPIRPSEAFIESLECEVPDSATIAFVRKFATFHTYGGGQQGRIRLADDVVLELLDAWEGTDSLVSDLAAKLEDHLNGLRDKPLHRKGADATSP